MLRIALLAVSLPLLALGAVGLYDVAANRQQTTLTCGDLERQPPGARWIRLTGCEVDYTHPGVRPSTGLIRELYFPVRTAGRPQTSPAPLVVATRDPQALAVAQGTIGDGREPDTEELTVMGLRIVTLLKASREVEGVVRSGPLERLQTRSVLEGLSTPLASSFVALDLHGRPSPMVPGIETGAGVLGLLTAAVLSLRRRRAAAPIVEPPAASVPGTGMPAELESFSAIEPEPPARVELPDPLEPFGEAPILEPVHPAMMLLNLDAAAGLDAIEHAPPLGSGRDVAGRLSSACGVTLDEGGRGTLAGQGFSIAIDAGVPGAGPVWTATLIARGPAALDGLRRLAAQSGWRIFVPRQGTFLAASDREIVMKR